MAKKDRPSPARQAPGQVVSATASMMWQGPIPPAHEMEQYERILPGAADRILAMAESQSDHRQHLETTVVEGNLTSETQGRWFGLAIVSGGFGFSAWMVSRGQSGEAATVIIGQLAILAGLFIHGRSEQRKEREQRFQQLRSITPPGS